MTQTCSLIVFTDLDGTLIDHETYDWAPARQALHDLGQISALIVLASSKTAAEMSVFRAKLGIAHCPAIVENGAGVLPPDVTEVPDASQYSALRSALNGLPAGLRGLFRGFGDVTPDQLARMTGLTPHDAKLAQQRSFSEPGKWTGTEREKLQFLSHLQKHGISAQQGGRFLTLSFGRDKVDQMRALIKAYQPHHTIALGDAPNDVAMLEQADFGVVVANPHHLPLPPLKGEAEGRILRTKDAGPSGWNAAMRHLLNQLELH